MIKKIMSTLLTLGTLCVGFTHASLEVEKRADEFCNKLETTAQHFVENPNYIDGIQLNYTTYQKFQEQRAQLTLELELKKQELHEYTDGCKTKYEIPLANFNNKSLKTLEEELKFAQDKFKAYKSLAALRREIRSASEHESARVSELRLQEDKIINEWKPLVGDSFQKINLQGSFSSEVANLESRVHDVKKFLGWNNNYQASCEAKITTLEKRQETYELQENEWVKTRTNVTNYLSTLENLNKFIQSNKSIYTFTLQDYLLPFGMVGASMFANTHNYKHLTYAGILLSLYSLRKPVFYTMRKAVFQDALEERIADKVINKDITSLLDVHESITQERVTLLTTISSDIQRSLNELENKRQKYDKVVTGLTGLGLLGCLYNTPLSNAAGTVFQKQGPQVTSFCGSFFTNVWNWTRSAMPSWHTIINTGGLFKNWITKNSTPLMATWAGLSTVGWFKAYTNNKDLQKQMNEFKRSRTNSESSGCESGSDS